MKTLTFAFVFLAFALTSAHADQPLPNGMTLPHCPKIPKPPVDPNAPVPPPPPPKPVLPDEPVMPPPAPPRYTPTPGSYHKGALWARIPGSESWTQAVLAIVQDGVVIQIDRTEKTRFDKQSPPPKRDD